MTRSCVFVFSFLLASLFALGDEKLPVPPDSDLKPPLALIKEVYGEEHANAKTNEQFQTLARKLYSQALKIDEPVERFAMLRVARDIAVQGRDYQTAFRTIDRIDRTFQIDAVRMKASVLYSLSKTARFPVDRKPIVRQALSLVDLAVARDDFELSGKLAQMALSEAKKSRDANIVKDATARTKEIDELNQAFVEVTAALGQLKANPKDPGANLAVGRYRCLVKGDWEEGLPLLALGSDADLKALAAKELGEVTQSAEQLQLGDGWWDLAENEKGTRQKHLQKRAAHWYLRAAPSLSGLTEKRIAVRMEAVGHDASTAFRSATVKSDPQVTTTNADFVKTGTLGIPQGRPFEDVAPTGALLVGLLVTKGHLGKYPYIGTVQPVFGNGRGSMKASKAYGEIQGPRTELVAKQGYAVGSIIGRSEVLIDGFQLVFMRIGPAGLDANDSYKSAWIGSESGKLQTLTGDGKFVVGIYGRHSRAVNQFGLIWHK